MLRLLLLIIASAPLFAAQPTSSRIGPVAIAVEEGSFTELVLEAVRKPFTEEWLENYTPDPMRAGEILAPVLTDALPLSNPIAGIESSGTLDILDTATGAVYTFLSEDGRIIACYPSNSPDRPEL